MRRLFVLALLAVVLSGCGSSLMMKADTMLDPSADAAVVNFLRPSYFGGAIDFGLWDRDTLVGILDPGRVVQYHAAPGDHLFMARAENWSVIKATVDAGKNYYVLLEPRFGLMRARVKMSVLDPGDERIEKWMAELEPSAVIPEKHDAYVNPRLEHVHTAIRNVEEGKAEFSLMEAADGR